MEVVNSGNLSEIEFANIESIVSKHHQLLDMLNCQELEMEKRLNPEIVTQDEYTHDVIVEWGDGIFLVYDTN